MVRTVFFFFFLININVQAFDFLNQLLHRHVKISAWGFYDVNKELLFMVNTKNKLFIVLFAANKIKNVFYRFQDINLGCL